MGKGTAKGFFVMFVFLITMQLALAAKKGQTLISGVDDILIMRIMLFFLFFIAFFIGAKQMFKAKPGLGGLFGGGDKSQRLVVGLAMILAFIGAWRMPLSVVQGASIFIWILAAFAALALVALLISAVSGGRIKAGWGLFIVLILAAIILVIFLLPNLPVYGLGGYASNTRAGERIDDIWYFFTYKTPPVVVLVLIVLVIAALIYAFSRMGRGKGGEGGLGGSWLTWLAAILGIIAFIFLIASFFTGLIATPFALFGGLGGILGLPLLVLAGIIFVPGMIYLLYMLGKGIFGGKKLPRVPTPAGKDKLKTFLTITGILGWIGLIAGLGFYGVGFGAGVLGGITGILGQIGFWVIIAIVGFAMLWLFIKKKGWRLIKKIPSPFGLGVNIINPRKGGQFNVEEGAVNVPVNFVIKRGTPPFTWYANLRNGRNGLEIGSIRSGARVSNDRNISTAITVKDIRENIYDGYVEVRVTDSSKKKETATASVYPIKIIVNPERNEFEQKVEMIISEPGGKNKIIYTNKQTEIEFSLQNIGKFVDVRFFLTTNRKDIIYLTDKPNRYTKAKNYSISWAPQQETDVAVIGALVVDANNNKYNFYSQQFRVLALKPKEGQLLISLTQPAPNQQILFKEQTEGFPVTGVITANNKPIKGVKVEISLNEKLAGKANTDSKGRFSGVIKLKGGVGIDTEARLTVTASLEGYKPFTSERKLILRGQKALPPGPERKLIGGETIEQFENKKKGLCNEISSEFARVTEQNEKVGYMVGSLYSEIQQKLANLRERAPVFGGGEEGNKIKQRINMFEKFLKLCQDFNAAQVKLDRRIPRLQDEILKGAQKANTQEQLNKARITKSKDVDWINKDIALLVKGLTKLRQEVRRAG